VGAKRLGGEGEKGGEEGVTGVSHQNILGEWGPWTKQYPGERKKVD